MRRMARRVLRVVLAVFMIGIGIGHFVNPGPFVAIVPAWLPAPLALVMVSGFFEILGGAGLLVTRVRRAASYGLVALYVAVFPANLNMAIHGIQPTDVHVPAWAAWARLPLQIVFIVLALWVGKTDDVTDTSARPAGSR
jgi:uncharacterized membrane protein